MERRFRAAGELKRAEAWEKDWASFNELYVGIYRYRYTRFDNVRQERSLLASERCSRATYKRIVAKPSVCALLDGFRWNRRYLTSSRTERWNERRCETSRFRIYERQSGLIYLDLHRWRCQQAACRRVSRGWTRGQTEDRRVDFAQSHFGMQLNAVQRNTTLVLCYQWRCSAPFRCVPLCFAPFVSSLLLSSSHDPIVASLRPVPAASYSSS